jgi:NAD(P)-dependent dehydrogenase (short-subunit alcohol dehydrogenase family)
MDLGLQGKTAVVTGGASTIGKAIVEGLCAEGVNVVIADMDEVQAERVVAQLRAVGHNASFVTTDVGERTQVEHLTEQVLAEHGQVDILVNGAGWTVNGLFLDKP